MDEYISIKEFAEMAGVSRQAIQQRTETSLAQYVKANEQGKKTIHRNALQFYGVEINKAKTQGTTENSKADEQESKAKTQGTNNDILYSALLQTVEILQSQLAAKDKQIESLCNALESAQKAATQAQQLHAGTIQRELIEAHTDPQEAPQQQEPKKGFFSRWRGGK